MARIKGPVLTFCVHLSISATLFVARSMIKDRPRACIQFPYTSLPSLRTPCDPPDASAQLQVFYEEFSTSARVGSTPLVIPFKFLREKHIIQRRVSGNTTQSSSCVTHRFNPIDQVLHHPFCVTVPSDVCQAVFEMNRSWRSCATTRFPCGAFANFRVR